MKFRSLGKTGLEVSVVGLGTEYLNKQPRAIVESVVREAIANGVNYFDLVFSLPEYLDNLSVGFQGQRDRIFMTGHLGSTEKNGRYAKSHSVKKCESVFLDLLSRLNTDYVDVLFLHNCDRPNAYDKIMKPKGLLELAQRLKQEGKARFIGFSGHTVATARQAVETGEVDVLMFPLGLAGNAVPGKLDLLKTCGAYNVGVVAMKPFAGGKLLNKGRTINVARYQMGGDPIKVKKSAPITPLRCLAYALAQPSVSTTVPGCSSVDQLHEALAYSEASDEEKDFSEIVTDFQQYISGECVYCNHCQPCPEVIDIGQTFRLLDMARPTPTKQVRAEYAAMAIKASSCTECGVCETRCPFGVNVTGKMQEAVDLFE